MLIEGLFDTALMVNLSFIISALIGIPIGGYLYSYKLNSKKKNILMTVISFIINAWRSVPFMILMIAVIPVSRFIVGSSIGTLAAVVPLSLAAIPFVARVIESSLDEVPKDLILMGRSLGGSPLFILTRIVLPESLPGVIQGLTLTYINLLAYSAMAGAFGGGGLGDIALRYGYHRFDTVTMMKTIVLIVFYVWGIQILGDKLANRFNHKVKIS